jgi:FkbM family methyltransferase
LVAPKIAADAKTFVREVEPGIQFEGNTRDVLGLYVWLFGVWQPNLTAFLRSRLKPGRVLVDVGANIGWFTLQGSRQVGAVGSVVAIEASPLLAEALRANLRRNHADNVRVVVAAAWSGPGTLVVEHGPAENLGVTHVRPDQVDPGQSAVVPCNTIPRLLAEDELARCRLVKIDVEGAEYDAVAGLGQGLALFPDDTEFIVEIDPNRATRPRQVAALLATFTEAGYRAYRLPNSYSLRHYYLDSVVPALEPLQGEPTSETDVVFSRQGEAALLM